MKVEGPGNIRGSGSVRRTGKAEGTSGAAFSKQLVGESNTAQGVGATASMSGVSGVLALQEVDATDDATARASRGKMRAEEMLDKLEEIQHGLLSGSLSTQKLMDLAKVVQTRRAQVDDPDLAEILDEIDLRAQVELAKLTS
ncbi:flagellar assembly protein FliX [Azospirillum doebereinerae]|uniref:Flagellar assembly protein FliX n=1 Tax=Azospirillum doebereinerae TaxID=92933 RepID=A0A3S1CGW3_9PROT|nr:flagellar assembly protein FliX [Azospirillum doebereinerae]MCG5239876.1 flagellar assembly protein FliX [Azospirillum doebereinerae]RUQ70700.1 flagellar assembly protein FliX [Azospirillum doebereinerae]